MQKLIKILNDFGEQIKGILNLIMALSTIVTLLITIFESETEKGVVQNKGSNFGKVLAFLNQNIDIHLYIFLLIILIVIILYLRVRKIKPFKPKTSLPQGISIDHPQAGDSCASPITVSGKYINKLPDGSIYAIEHNPRSQQYWPKEKSSINEIAKTWSTVMHIGNGDNENRFLKIVFAEDSAISMIEYFKKIRGNGCTGNVGFDKLTNNFHTLAEVKIVLKKP
jgi:hypothetical protein